MFFLNCFQVSRFLRFSDDGAIFIYGYLASGNLSVTDPSYPNLVSSFEHNDGYFAIRTLFAFQVSLLNINGYFLNVAIRLDNYFLNSFLGPFSNLLFQLLCGSPIPYRCNVMGCDESWMGTSSTPWHNCCRVYECFSEHIFGAN